MKIGDYVRTEDGHIDRIIKISDEMKSGRTIKVQIGEKDIIGGYEDFVDWFSPSHFIKSSPNITDLIEEHDILKIEEQKGIYTICEVEVFKEPHTENTFLGVRIDNRPFAKRLYELNIKSIVTREMFEKMEYKVGD